MGSVELHPGPNALAGEPLSPQLFGFDPPFLAKDAYGKAPGRKSKPIGPRRAGKKLLLEAKDFVLPELVQHADNGDLSVSIAESTDAVQAEQIFRLAEHGEETGPGFWDLPRSDQQLTRRRYFDYLKRVPKKEAACNLRRDELETWRRGGDEAESNFLAWWERGQRRKQTALFRKANRLANCGASGRRLDCSNHEGHQFFAEFKCQNRYCRRCGADVFSKLFGKYVGLWLTVKRLLPANGFRSCIIIAKLDFTAVNLERMPLPAEIREFNQDIRECIKRVCRENGLGSVGYGFLWCDEFGGWDPKKNSYNTNLHAHGVYVGPHIPQKLIARHWAEIRSGKDGAKVVWISKQKIDHPPDDFHECERRRFIRALGHALKYTGKHVSRSDGERLAQLEVAFQGVRRVHTMGLFYHADLRCLEKCGECDGRCELVSGHQGDHHCKYHGSGNRCPLCDGHLMFPRDSGYARVADLKKEGRRELAEVRRQASRDRVLHRPRGPDA
jgi:hypothetical protein